MPKLVDHVAYREELLRASFEVVAETGFGSLSMKQLAASLNISTGLIYHYFKNKEEWFVSLVVHFSQKTFERLSNEIRPEYSLDEKTERLAAEVARNRDLYANMIRVASDFARMQRTRNAPGMLHISIALNHLYQHVAMLFETDEPTARALASYTAGVILSSRLDPQGVAADECLHFIRKILAVCPPAEQGAAC